MEAPVKRKLECDTILACFMNKLFLPTPTPFLGPTTPPTRSIHSNNLARFDESRDFGFKKQEVDLPFRRTKSEFLALGYTY